MKDNGLREFYRDIKGELIEEKPSSSTSASSASAGSASSSFSSASSAAPGLSFSGQKPSGKSAITPAAPETPAHQIIDAGKQHEKLALNHKALVSLLDQARGGNSKAIGEVVKRYGFDPREIEVTITEPMRDSGGKEPEKFGIRLIQSEEEWASLTRDWETAAAYFPDIELHNLGTTRRNKRLAVVMGVSAREFNAVIAAERRREKLESDMRTLGGTMEKGRKDMGVDKMPRVPTGMDKQLLPQTPPKQKSEAKSISPPRSTR